MQFRVRKNPGRYDQLDHDYDNGAKSNPSESTCLTD
jgi:hypothetical protein